MKERIDKNKDITSNSKQIEILKKNFPSCFDKDGNFSPDKLNEIVGKETNITNESYSLNWLGKTYARLLANLEPETMLEEDYNHNEKEENKNSNNIYIEGDNLEVLKHMVNAYSEKIKMIYIDPPYNTGIDFIYKDDRKFTKEELSKLANIDEEEAQRVLEFTNSNSNSHSAWLTFMYPRLYVARELLKEDGVIFISIDDNEQAQLKILCDEVFGEENFINLVTVKTKDAGVTGSTAGKSLKGATELLLIYSKRKKNIKFNQVYDKSELISYIENMKQKKISWKYTSILLNEGELEYITSTVDGSGDEIKIYRNKNYKISNINEVSKKENLTEKEVYYKYINQIFTTSLPQSSIRGRVLDVIGDDYDLITIEYVPKSGKNKDKLYKQYYKGDKKRLLTWLKDVVVIEDEDIYKKDMLSTLWDQFKYNNLSKEGDINFENGKKPLEMIKKVCDFNLYNNDIILDFFSGSSTTAHAVMDLNTKDNGNRKFIMVNLPESIDEKKNKSTYEFCVNELKEEPVITTIGKERIRRAAKKIKEDNKDKEYINDIDLGFKVYKTKDLIETNYFESLEKLEEGSQFNLLNKDLSEEDIKSLLLTWKLYDGIEINKDFTTIDFANYTSYYLENKLYLMYKDFDNNKIKLLLEKIDEDKNFNPRKIILFANNFNTKELSEIKEAIKGYRNKKGIELEVENRY